MSFQLDTIIFGDAKDVLMAFPDSSVDLTITSPPYAERRKKTYGGVPESKYVEWFLPISANIFRSTKPLGSFILIIREHASKGERSLYVWQLVIAIRSQGWKHVETYIWHKRNCFPGKWSNRFRNAWEYCFHFAKTTTPTMYQEVVMVSVSEATKKRIKKLGANDRLRYAEKTASGFGKRVENWVGRDKVYPTNVLYFATETKNRGHSAAFPLALPAWFIQLFTKEGGVICDPFIGSGTTALAAKKLNRYYIGIDNNSAAHQAALSRLDTYKNSKK